VYVIQSVAALTNMTVSQSTEAVANEQQTDVDFLCSLPHVTSLSDLMSVDGDSSWLKLVDGSIITKSTSARRRRHHLHLEQFDPCPQSPLRSDENAASLSPFVRRSLFSRRVMTSTPLRDVTNTTPKSSYRRCASDTAATVRGRQRPENITMTHSMSTSVLAAAVTDNDDQRLIGDFTRLLCLPLVDDAKHCDLNSISSHTVCITQTTHVDTQCTVTHYLSNRCSFVNINRFPKVRIIYFSTKIFLNIIIIIIIIYFYFLYTQISSYFDQAG